MSKRKIDQLGLHENVYKLPSAEEAKEVLNELKIAQIKQAVEEISKLILAGGSLPYIYRFSQDESKLSFEEWREFSVSLQLCNPDYEVFATKDYDSIKKCPCYKIAVFIKEEHKSIKV
jgi:hypothetical protein